MITSPFHPDYKHVGNEPENIDMEPNLPTPTKHISKPKRPCGVRNCQNKTTDTFCSEHKHLSSRNNWNNNEVHPWYQLRLWRGNPNRTFGKRGGLRERQLKQDPLCEHCKNKGITKPATVADHRKEWKDGETEAEQWDLFTDFDNLQSLCTSCHNSKTSKGNK